MLLSPNSELSEDLKDSVAAKSAQSLLLKWHSHMPFATLHELKDMYNKFYEYYYEHYTKHEPHEDFYHHHHHHHHHHHEYEPHMYHHDHLEHYLSHNFGSHHHHSHQNLNLLDFISSKPKENSPNILSKLFGEEGSDFYPDHTDLNMPFHHSNDHFNEDHDYDHHFPGMHEYDHELNRFHQHTDHPYNHEYFDEQDHSLDHDHFRDHTHFTEHDHFVDHEHDALQ